VGGLPRWGRWSLDLRRRVRPSTESLPQVVEAAFGGSIPETVNSSHILVLVAEELDASSERIINYLADEHGVSINAVFFSFFQDADIELVSDRRWTG
jgi:hypothetical protein